MEKEILYGLIGLVAGASASGVYYKFKLSKLRNNSLEIFKQIGDYYCLYKQNKIEALKLRDNLGRLRTSINRGIIVQDVSGINIIYNTLESELTK